MPIDGYSDVPPLRLRNGHYVELYAKASSSFFDRVKICKRKRLAPTMFAYVFSLVVGLGSGALYRLLSVKSPAPPLIALLGLLGMLCGEAVVSSIRGHTDVVATLMHRKSFDVEHRMSTSVPPPSNNG